MSQFLHDCSDIVKAIAHGYARKVIARVEVIWWDNNGYNFRLQVSLLFVVLSFCGYIVFVAGFGVLADQ